MPTDSPWRHWEPPQIPAFHFDADPNPDPAFHFDADPNPDPAFHFDAKWIRLPKMMEIIMIRNTAGKIMIP